MIFEKRDDFMKNKKKTKKEILDELIAKKEKNQLRLEKLKKDIVNCENRILRIQGEIDKIQGQISFQELTEFLSEIGFSLGEVVGLLYRGEFEELRKVYLKPKNKQLLSEIEE